jgi:hypothetical protein
MDRQPIRVSSSEGYALWAVTWDSTPSPIVALEHRTLLPWIENLHPRRTIDVGCGTGRWTADCRHRCDARRHAIHRRPQFTLRGRPPRPTPLRFPSRSACADLFCAPDPRSHSRRAAAPAELSRILGPAAF